MTKRTERIIAVLIISAAIAALVLFKVWTLAPIEGNMKGSLADLKTFPSYLLVTALFGCATIMAGMKGIDWLNRKEKSHQQ